MAKIPLKQLNPLALAIFWRCVPVVIIAGLAAEFGVGFILGAVGHVTTPRNANDIQMLSQIVSFCACCLGAYFILRSVLRSLVGKRIGELTILPAPNVAGQKKPLIKSDFVTGEAQ